MHLLVQEILVLWTKAARREPLASQRSKVTNASELPAWRASQDSLLKHQLVYSENWGFGIPKESWEELPLIRAMQHGCVNLHRESEVEWEIFYQHNVSCGGPPQRSGGPRRQTLAAEQWGRVYYSGRVPDHDQVLWLYYARTLNIAYVTRPEPRLFLDVAPKWVIEDNPSTP